MKKHTKKMIAPIVVTALFVLYYLGFAIMCFTVPGLPVAAKIVMGVVPAVLMAAMIYLMIKRIKEIRSGEEDDLSKY